MIGIGGLVEILAMTVRTNRGSAGIAVFVTLEAFSGYMGACEREVGGIVVKSPLAASGWVALETGQAVV